MATQIKRKVFDFLAKNYKTSSCNIEILSEEPNPQNIRAQPDDKSNFIQRWYLSLQGEDNPIFSKTVVYQQNPVEQHIYRYDWVFGVALIEPYWWDWMDELEDESALAIHIILESTKDAPEAIPISATLNALHPSRNTKSIWELTLPKIPEAIAEVAKVAALAYPALNYVPSTMMLTSNIVESYTENQKNWFLYQFLDERLKCPTVEWRINKKVLYEYGPLLRGVLFIAFHGSNESSSGHVRMVLRPQIRYCRKSALDFIIPTDKLQEQVFIEIMPKDEKRPQV